MTDRNETWRRVGQSALWVEDILPILQAMEESAGQCLCAVRIDPDERTWWAGYVSAVRMLSTAPARAEQAQQGGEGDEEQERYGSRRSHRHRL